MNQRTLSRLVLLIGASSFPFGLSLRPAVEPASAGLEETRSQSRPIETVLRFTPTEYRVTFTSAGTRRDPVLRQVPTVVLSEPGGLAAWVQFFDEGPLLQPGYANQIVYVNRLIDSMDAFIHMIESGQELRVDYRVSGNQTRVTIEWKESKPIVSPRVVSKSKNKRSTKPDSFEGKINLTGEFRVLQLQNHYPSGGNPQSFGCTLEVKGKRCGDLSQCGEIDTFILNFSEQQVKGIRRPVVKERKKDEYVLHVHQPLGSLPAWIEVLENFQDKSHQLHYKVTPQSAHAFLNPNHGTWRGIGAGQ